MAISSSHLSISNRIELAVLAFVGLDQNNQLQRHTPNPDIAVTDFNIPFEHD